MCLTAFVLCGVALTLSGCSYKTNFVIVNESGQLIEVRYQVKDHPGPFYPPVPPASMSAGDLSSKANNNWSELPASRLQIDEAQRTVTVLVKPNEALLVASMHNYFGHDNEWDAREFPIQEINVLGSKGKMSVVGDQTRRSFSKVSIALYTLTYK
jgi:hypothetical protein